MTMDTTGNFPNAGGSPTATDKAADSLKDGIRSAQQGFGQVASSAVGKVDQLRDEATPALEKARAKAQELGQKGADALSDASKQLRDRALEASDAAAAYAKDEPMKALLIAAAAGALLMGLLSMMVRSND
jgi:ElaB/YqjD/DUF883 family membrane-anchored ribosome-binding protein